MSRFTSADELEAAIIKLIAIEPRFGPVHHIHGTPSLRAAPANLETLLIIITEQFLSLNAAAAIWARLKDHIGEVTSAHVVAVPIEKLVELGLSRSKAKCFHACATAGFDFEELMALDLAEIRTALLEVWGIGPWTADIFLLSAASHTDAWPVGDVALQAAAQHLFSFRKRPDQKRMEKIAAKWRPYRAAAARLLWAHYRGIKAGATDPQQRSK